MPSRPRLTATGLLAESFGRRPYTVTLREEKEAGANVLLDYTVASGARRKRTLGYPVRARDGRRWRWDEAALEKARDAAEDRSAELRLTRQREEVLDADVLTFGQAVDRYTDERTGGLPKDRRTQGNYLRYLRNWKRVLGEDTPWNRITPNLVIARAKELERAGYIPNALNEARVLRILYRWLTGPARVSGLLDPMQGFPWRRLRNAHKPDRPRYSRDELKAIVRVRHDVDPRFALFIALMDDCGARRKAVQRVMRSMVDCPLEREPSAEEAPHGWILLPALKGQAPPLYLVTPFVRRELELALDGYLRNLEAAYRAGELEDYPLFPGARLADKKEKVVEVGQARALQPVEATLANDWLREAERLAKVEHVHRRGYHGIRRAVSDILLEEIGLDGLTAAMGWSSRTTPEQIYIDRTRMPDRVRARRAMERRRQGTEGPK